MNPSHPVEGYGYVWDMMSPKDTFLFEFNNWDICITILI